MTPPYPDEGNSMIGGSAFVGQERRHLHSDVAGVEDNRSALTHVTGTSAKSSFWGSNLLDAGIGARGRTRGWRRQRCVLGDKELRRKDQRAELEADRKEYAALGITEVDGVDHHGMSAGQPGGIEAKGPTSEVASRVGM